MVHRWLVWYWFHRDVPGDWLRIQHSFPESRTIANLLRKPIYASRLDPRSIDHAKRPWKMESNERNGNIGNVSKAIAGRNLVTNPVKSNGLTWHIPQSLRELLPKSAWHPHPSHWWAHLKWENWHWLWQSWPVALDCVPRRSSFWQRLAVVPL